MSSASPSNALESVFQTGPIILDFKEHAYNPCNDLIFPTILKVAEHLSKPVAPYYLYYAPHDSPGGICLAHAPSVDGPWTEHPRNPVLSKDWQPHYKVGHVSAPHALWIPEESRIFVYYHGDNDQTHFAVSKDGMNFEYGGVAVDQFMFRDYVKGVYDRVFYGRVFAHRIPSKNCKYVFLFARSSQQGLQVQGIYLSWSDDARTWSKPVRVIERGEGMTFVCSPCLFAMNDRYYVAYHADFSGYTDTYVNEFDAELSATKPLGKLFDHRRYGETNPRVSDPLIYLEGGTAHLVVAVGKAFNQRFGLSKAKVEDLARALLAARGA